MYLYPLTIGTSDRGAMSSVSQGGMDDLDKLRSLDAGEAPRRSTSSLDGAMIDAFIGLLGVVYIGLASYFLRTGRAWGLGEDDTTISKASQPLAFWFAEVVWMGTGIGLLYWAFHRAF